MITLPAKPKITKLGKNQAAFEIEGCYPGYGLTLGNSFRRVLLSSIAGAAITGVKIKDVKHEFFSIPHVIEDVIQIILNLKQIRFKLHKTDEPTKAFLKVKGEKEVKAIDIKTTAELEVITPDIHIASLTDKKAELEMEMTIEPGLGYLPVEQRKKEKIEVGQIAIDAIFTPVRKVTYNVEPMRVGDRTDYNRLRINIETDGSISPEDAFKTAAQILISHFQIFTVFKEEEKIKVEKESKKKIKEKDKKEDVSKVKIEDLKLSNRTLNALSKADLKTAGILVKKREKDLAAIEGLGAKGVKEIKKVLGRLGLTLKS
ncbi:MAG: DNA-directed RNA polymerase subunit alpha [Candidatus Portnoybacteria bacterium RIFCSPLOWO2_12_FULL_39_9]|uniref:DNA-directed RNA polymerase subunit alpha n=1 Tax=Candidatus Portnoybacteria bacterium RIFCSPHIGHO2_12_FULL_38_9 TaxID=1801997 RepID=A0A1G2FEL5_9BACT|nr:MAG: DNA-directed RNA polymerase subunit alpha [Candidatus Portnoybacteria bacterium RBG_13_40_8]OGZ36158.1 MAG: DNA-directed RNA polymerase subunit alpha [Candidatus Portnoybacteria bacterium RIFCSPHIGHO2_02_FULL_39_12]OGZ36516.1 MAG: DNA-directed RNA polymerase subunit alpha [Candidatus Portnoybacteria bacterium RIFCSPHIGHO2_12_FULL_38_9]OGZ38525.1 MAG: DNA-directed RNA polymerase subunit alpha [Candidatus Portnoybacteria bacterium RIFCSPLOWO2_01_FULL_38_39]OGZ41296.1 MAG: DNA-directed RNA